MKMSVIHASIKLFLLSKGFISEAEAKSPGYLATTEAAYVSFCVNKLGLHNQSTPHNEESFPKAILEDEDFVIVDVPDGEGSDVLEVIQIKDSSSSQDSRADLLDAKTKLEAEAKALEDEAKTKLEAEAKALEAKPKPNSIVKK